MTAEKVAQVLLDEHRGHAGAALLDLAHRYLYALNGVSAGYLRWGQNDLGGDPKIDVPPNPITDDWIATGVDA